MSTDCSRINVAGVGYEEISCLYPALEKFYTDAERDYDPVPVRDYLVGHPWVPVLACILYGIGIVVGKAYFSTREPWNWRKLLAVWNLGLATFSAIGFVRVLPQVLHNIVYHSVQDQFCLDPEAHFGSGSAGLWVQLFVLSKFPELIDTFFIVIHKKKLIFLHWYHHVTVLLYCWHSYVTKAPNGIFFCLMNYGVHSVMYFYYFLMAVKMRPKWWNPMVITALQISQMIGGVILTIMGFVYTGSNDTCWMSPENNRAAFVMYGSYLFLFMQFFVKRYSKKKQTAKKVD